MNSKKIISAILTLSFLATSIPLSVHASDANNEIYQETGQIIFDNLNVEVKDNELTYAPKMRSLSASLQQIKLDKELEKNPGFEEATGRTSLGTTGRQQSQATVTREWSTKYVHTWESISPSFSISATGVGISGTPTDKSWQIVTYVAY